VDFLFSACRMSLGEVVEGGGRGEEEAERRGGGGGRRSVPGG
jgi:hypothetical protein